MGDDTFLRSRVGDFQSILDAPPPAAGIEVEEDGKRYVSAYNETGSASAKGEVATIAYSNDYGTEVIAAATTTFPVRTAVGVKAYAQHELGWWQIAGEAEALVEGTTDVAAGDFLEVLNTETAFKKDGASRTTVSGAVAIDAQATNSAVLSTVRLIPEQHTIAGS